jgi:hypothetical protein
MLRAAIAAIAILVTSSMLTSPASAGVLPCTGQSLIKVLDVFYPPGLEGRQVIKLRDQKVHLGYLFMGCFKGEWVGFIAEDQPHVPLTDQQLRALLYVTGLKELPPTPSYWSSPENHRKGVMWLILGLVVIIAAVLQQMGVMTRKDEAPEQEVNFNGSLGNSLAANVDGVPTSYRSALSAVERAASEQARVAISGTVPPPRQPSLQSPQVARFGKR